MQNISGETAIGEIVAADFRTAAVFERYGIDFCCGGKVSLTAVCTEKGVDLAALTVELVTAQREPARRDQFYRRLNS